MIASLMMLSAGIYSCVKEDIQPTVESNIDETSYTRSSTTTQIAYRASDGNVYLLNDPSEIDALEQFIAQQEQDIADGLISRPRLKFESSRCTAPDGSRGLKCEKTKSGDCQDEFDCVSAGDNGDY